MFNKNGSVSFSACKVQGRKVKSKGLGRGFGRGKGFGSISVPRYAKPKMTFGNFANAGY